MRDILEDSIQRLLADHVTPALLRESEKGTLATALWQLIETLGFPHALVRESAGGSGLAWPDVYPLVMACGQHGLPLPLPETMLAAWLLDQTGLAVPSGALSIVDTTGTAAVQATHTLQGWQLTECCRWCRGAATPGTQCWKCAPAAFCIWRWWT